MRRNPKEGFEHLDIQPFPHVEYVADARNIPLLDGSVSEIYTANTIEHFWWYEIEPLLKEWYRVLEVGGRIEVFTPDSEFIMQQYLNGRWIEEVKACPKEAGYGWIHGSDVDRNMWLNFKLHGTGAPGNAHLTAFSFDMIKILMERAGLSRIKRLIEPNYTLGVEAFK